MIRFLLDRSIQADCVAFTAILGLVLNTNIKKSCHFVLRRLYESAYVSSLTTLYYEERVFLLFILLFIKTCSRKFAIVKPTNMRKIRSRCDQNLDTTDDKISQIPVGRCTSPLTTILLTEYLPNHTIVSLHYNKGLLYYV